MVNPITVFNFAGLILKDFSINEMVGADAFAVVRPTGFYLLDIVCYSIEFYVLLILIFALISCLYRDLLWMDNEHGLHNGPVFTIDRSSKS